jgi:hypothetical protein
MTLYNPQHFLDRSIAEARIESRVQTIKRCPHDKITGNLYCAKCRCTVRTLHIARYEKSDQPIRDFVAREAQL